MSPGGRHWQPTRRNGKVGVLIKDFGRQEATHVEALKGAVEKLGGTPAAKPAGKFPISSAGQVAQLAFTVENLGAAAYLGQAADILIKALTGHSPRPKSWPRRVP
jgi:hypothetical protein